MRRGGLLAARAALVAVARVLVVALAWVPPGGGPGPCPGPGLPPRWGALCGACRGAVGRRSAGAGGSYLPPSAPGLAQLLGHGACGGGGAICGAGSDPGHKMLRQLLPLPPDPLPPAGGRGKAWDNGKEDSYERNPGGVSFVLNLIFFELYKVRKNLFSLSKKLFSTG